MLELLGDAGDSCDWVWIRLTVSGGRIADAAGEGPGVAELARAVWGLTLLEAAAVPAPGLAGDALAAAIGPAVAAPPSLRRVAVAMSGGVDSAVALLETRNAGSEAIGVTLRLWVDPAGPDGERACCSPRAVTAARELCHRLGIPHVTLDLRDSFRAAVVRPFVDGYARGDTPNPCVRCNGTFRFAALNTFAQRIGAAALATGHYARLVEHRGRLLLARGADRAKDQSYMLGRLDPSLLPRLRLPLGERTKEETRAVARAAGLAAAARADSQEACFLGGDDYRAFLARHGLPARDGPLFDLAGREVGRHDGYWRFTPGQRRGLRLHSAAGPLFAVSTDPARNAVVVGPRHALARRSVIVRPGTLHVPARHVEAQLRYRSPAVRAAVRERDEETLELRLDEPFHGLAAGQAAVLYEDDTVVGAGLVAAP
ncbi:MAG: tRNA 2-thiouridine(34) synthase MnmA [Thermoleophilia bacterium]|nr:tRNA 2-thiouridine(34) synthase MnmA [Thermoleophilia bacterium]